jgi:hypothetical protein
MAIQCLISIDISLQSACIKLIIGCKADVNYIWKDIGMNALGRAASCGNLDTVEALLQCKVMF